MASGRVPSQDLGVVIVAGGSGTRFGDAGKVFASLSHRPVLAYSLTTFARIRDVADIVLVLGEHTVAQGRALLASLGIESVRICLGGATRSDSVRAGLAHLDHRLPFVAVHDAARPLISSDVVERVLTSARSTGAAVPVVPVRDTIHVAGSDGRMAGVLDRDSIRAAQTPQIVRRDWLERVYTSNNVATDEAGLLYKAGFPVAFVEGDPANVKITWPEDLAIAAAILATRGDDR